VSIASGGAEIACGPLKRKHVKHHSAQIGGGQIDHIARAATYIIEADRGTPNATFFPSLIRKTTCLISHEDQKLLPPDLQKLNAEGMRHKARVC